MKRFWLGVAALSIVSACGGGNNVFNTGSSGGSNGGGSGGTPPTTGSVPAAIAGEIDNVTFAPGDATTPPSLLIEGAAFDVAGAPAVYVRKPAMDVPGFQAFSSQVDGDSRHYTAFVRERDGVVAVVSGSGQFAQFLAGAYYTRSGAYSDPQNSATLNTGSVTYNGEYVGIINRAGDQGDLLTPSGSSSANPVQVAEVTGTTRIQADFNNDSDGRNVIGAITNRVVVDPVIDSDTDGTPDPNVPVADLIFRVNTLNEDGTFGGSVALPDLTNVGTYTGAFTGTEATAVGGALTASNHINQLSDSPVTEFGAFTASR